MSNGAAGYTTDERKIAISDVRDYILGAPDVKSVYDQFENISLTDLKALLEPRIKSALLEDRSALHYDLALYRSLRYAVAGGRHCLVLGQVNNLRELYEGYRLRYPSEEDPKGNPTL